MSAELFNRLDRLPPDVQVMAMQDFKREFYRRSLFATARHLLGYKDVNWRTHGDMIRALESQDKRKLIVMPRGTFKSSISSVAFPIWRLLNDPDERILLDSELYSNSKNFLREIKMHLMRPELTELFGPFQADPWNEGEILIRQRTKIYKEASVTASGIGAEKTGQHYSLIVCDDLNSPTNSATTEGRQKVIQHYQYLCAILEPHGTLSLIGTRYAADDAIGFVLRNEIGLEGK